MSSQKSFSNERPTLYLVATPIGNLQEMTPRAIEILKDVDIIAAEDTRNTKKLLMHFDIETRLIAHHNFNENQSKEGLIKLLEQGKNIAVVSDAGYPLIQDPGQGIVNLCIEHDFNVVPISGACAYINALVASGIKTEPHLFRGFLSNANQESKNELMALKTLPYTLIFYEAPHRIERTLKNCLEILGDRKACLARELTKRYEEFIRGSLSELIEYSEDLKGEMVLIIEGAVKIDHTDELLLNIQDLVNEYAEGGMVPSEAIKRVAKEHGLSKNEVYRHYHQS